MKERMQVWQAAEVLKVSERTVRTHIKSGKLESEKEHGKRWVWVEIPDAEMEELVIVSEETEEATANDEAIMNLLKEKDARISDLQAQISEKDQQLLRRDDQTDSLTRQIDHLTQLLAVQSKTTAVLADQLDATKQLEDLRKRPSLWRKLFGRNS